MSERLDGIKNQRERLDLLLLRLDAALTSWDIAIDRYKEFLQEKEAKNKGKFHLPKKRHLILFLLTAFVSQIHDGEQRAGITHQIRKEEILSTPTIVPPLRIATETPIDTPTITITPAPTLTPQPTITRPRPNSPTPQPESTKIDPVKTELEKTWHVTEEGQSFWSIVNFETKYNNEIKSLIISFAKRNEINIDLVKVGDQLSLKKYLTEDQINKLYKLLISRNDQEFTIRLRQLLARS